MTYRLCLQSVILRSAVIISFVCISSAEQPTCSLLSFHFKVQMYSTSVTYISRKLHWLCKKKEYFPPDFSKAFNFCDLVYSLKNIFMEKLSQPVLGGHTEPGWGRVNFLFSSLYGATIQICGQNSADNAPVLWLLLSSACTVLRLSQFPRGPDWPKRDRLSNKKQRGCFVFQGWCCSDCLGISLLVRGAEWLLLPQGSPLLHLVGSLYLDLQSFIAFVFSCVLPCPEGRGWASIAGCLSAGWGQAF